MVIEKINHVTNMNELINKLKEIIPGLVFYKFSKENGSLLITISYTGKAPKFKPFIISDCKFDWLFDEGKNRTYQISKI